MPTSTVRQPTTVSSSSSTPVTSAPSATSRRTAANNAFAEALRFSSPDCEQVAAMVLHREQAPRRFNPTAA
ncbi:hypothetical protein AAFP30_09320 [Gordonia sp. CPCC 205515]|uniref:hypothetical protein n=1 Tax=Gordonia sp. CPCC 205515 TaxID=3140791 RepID=UPI003AF36362